MSTDAPPQQYCSRCLTSFATDLDECPNLSCRKKRPAEGWGRILRAGDVLDRTYRVHQMLAVGGAGVTYVARELDGAGDETGPRVAVKVLLAARDAGPYVRRLATEAQIIQELDHPNIVQYLGFVHKQGHSPYLITRYEAGGSLLDHLRRVGLLSVRQAAVIGRQICQALEKAHGRGIVHRDLKPENVLLTRPVPRTEDPIVRVADFGIAKVQGSLGGGLTRVGAFVGTPHYAAPEQFVGGAVTEAADVYSVGALLHFCVTARHVIRFADRLDPEDTFQLLCDSLPPTLTREGEDPLLLGRVNRILAVAMNKDPAGRCSVTELDRMLDDLLEGREPALPVRSPAESTADLPAVSPAAAPAAPAAGDGLGGLAAAAAMGAVGLAAGVALARALGGSEATAGGGGSAPAPGGIAGSTPSAQSTLGGGAPSSVGPTPTTAGPTPTTAGPTPTTAGPAATTAGPTPTTAGPAATTAGPTHTSAGPGPLAAAPAPTRSDTGGASPAPPRRGAMGVVLGVAALLVVLVGAAGAGLWVLRGARGGTATGGDSPDVGSLPVELTGEESDPAQREDHSRIALDARRASRVMRATCGVDAAAVIPVTLVIETDGRVRSARSTASAATAECVIEKLRGHRFPGERPLPVKLSLELGGSEGP